MAASLFPRHRGSGGGRRVYRPMAEINVTPFVDVMLVLLIIFMVTAPLLTAGVPLDLPRTSAQPLSQPEEPLVVSIDAKGDVFLQETKIEQGTLVPRLAAITGNKPDTRIYVRGDRTIAYGRIMEVMGLINAAGFTRVALVSEGIERATPAAQPAGARTGERTR